jgi:integrase
LEKTRKLYYIQRLKSGFHYFRGHPSGVKGRLPGAEGSPEYLAEYERLLAKAEGRKPEPPHPDGGGRPIRLAFVPPTLGWVATQFMAHDDFRKKRKVGTQAAYRTMIYTLLDSPIARVPITGLNRQHVRHHCDEVEKEKGNSRGDHQQLIISALWKFADQRLSKQCKLEDRSNPASGRKRTYKAKPRLAWPAAVRQRFIDGNPLAPTPQGRAPAPHNIALAASMLFETGQRRGDVCNMQRTHIEHDDDGHQWLMVEAQEKTGEPVPVPMHRDFLKALMKYGANGSDFILTTKTGKQFAKGDLSKAIQKRLIEIGEPKSKYTLHGLRKAAAVRLAELGATVEELMSFFGWRSPKMALYYVREANKRKLNRRAANLLERVARGERPARTVLSARAADFYRAGKCVLRRLEAGSPFVLL